jgi:hypothetical protein
MREREKESERGREREGEENREKYIFRYHFCIESIQEYVINFNN